MPSGPSARRAWFPPPRPLTSWLRRRALGYTCAASLLVAAGLFAGCSRSIEAPAPARTLRIPPGLAIYLDGELIHSQSNAELSITPDGEKGFVFGTVGHGVGKFYLKIHPRAGLRPPFNQGDLLAPTYLEVYIDRTETLDYEMRTLSAQAKRWLFPSAARKPGMPQPLLVAPAGLKPARERSGRGLDGLLAGRTATTRPESAGSSADAWEGTPTLTTWLVRLNQGSRQAPMPQAKGQTLRAWVRHVLGELLPGKQTALTQDDPSLDAKFEPLPAGSSRWVKGPLAGRQTLFYLTALSGGAYVVYFESPMLFNGAELHEVRVELYTKASGAPPYSLSI